MITTNMNTNSNLTPQSQRYSEKINATSQQFFAVLDDFKKYYVFFNKNPEVNEYQQFYLNNKTQLQNLNRDIFTTTNNIEKAIEQLSQLMTRMNAKLSSEKELDGELGKLVSKLSNTGNGASIMLEDTTQIYAKQYYQNVEICVGVIGIIGLLIKMFKQPTVIALNQTNK